MNSCNIDFCDNFVRYESQEIIDDCEDMPEDLSVKHRTVSVQTETFIQDKLEEIFEGFSQNQIKFFLEILSNFKKSKEDESFVRVCENFSNVSEKTNTPIRPVVWTPEPEAACFQKNIPGVAVPSHTITTYNHHPPSLNNSSGESQHDVRTPCTASVNPQTPQDEDYDERIDVEEDSSAPNQPHLTRDKKLVMKMKIPLTVEDIINTPMEVFNDLVCSWEATEEQINICRDIRRRGKNKIAAQNCRKRKMSQISNLETDLVQARMKKEKILSERVKLLWMKQEWRRKLEMIEKKVLKMMGKEENNWKLSMDSNLVVKVTERLEF